MGPVPPVYQHPAHPGQLTRRRPKPAVPGRCAHGADERSPVASTPRNPPTAQEHAMSTSHASAESPKSRLAAAMAQLNLTIHAEFVPWSKSRSAEAGAKVTERSLNWRVTLKHEGRDVLTEDYSAGIGHCPSYKQGARLTLDYVGAIAHETETGTTYRAGSVVFRGKPILPDPCDVLYSLLSDSDAIESPNFEAWASDHGYDSDSRKAEATYRACVAIGLALRAAVGDAGLSILRTAAQDY